MKTIKYIVTIKSWRDKTFGNTYSAGVIEDLNGKTVVEIPFTYGDDSHLEDQLYKALKLKRNNKTIRESRWLSQIAHISTSDCLQREVKALTRSGG